MDILRTVVVVLALVAGAAVHAENFPTDISVQLTAQPNTNLVPGQPIEFTLTVINHGPEAVDGVALLSSDYYDQFDLGFGSTDCEDLVVIIVDKETTFHYNLVWFPNGFGLLEVGESLTCHITLALSGQAPQNWPFSFGVAYFDTDINPTNNVSTVILRRGGATPVAVPTLSLQFLLLLGAALAATAWHTFRRTRNSAQPSG